VLLLLAAAPPAASAASPVGGTVDLASDADATFTPGGPEAKLGVVAAVGDVNGDAKTDYAVSYPYATRLGRDEAGVVKVVFGQSGGGLAGKIGLGDSEPGFEIVGNAVKRHLGFVVAGAGDVNGDGYGDLMIGSPGTRLSGSTSPTPEGFVYVVFGKATSAQVDTAKSATRFRIWGAPGDRAGSSVSAVGDVDGDGLPEIAVGAPAGLGGAGRVMVVLSSARAGDVNLATVGAGALEIDGAAAGDAAGSAVAGLPDVNGDGRADLAIGAKGAAQGSGSVAIIHLPAPGAGALSLASIPGGLGGIRVGPAGSAAGTALASVGDLTGDGIGDLAVGAPTASPAPTGSTLTRTRAGAVYLVSGSLGGTGSLGGEWLIGDRIGDRAGYSLHAGAAPGAAAATPAAAVAVGTPVGVFKNPTNGPLGRPHAGEAFVVFPSAARGQIDLGLPPPGAVARLVGPTQAHAGGTVALARDGATTSVLVGARTPQDAAAWGVRDVRPPAFPSRQTTECERDTNLEVIVDDSGSMSTNDSQFLAQQALDLLLTKPGNLNRITGAVEFGSRAQQIFAPVPAPGRSTGALHDLLAGLMSEHIRHDAGQTNFGDAFLAARAMNPTATARILITDGFATKTGFRPPDPAVVQAVPTWVIGLGQTRAPGAAKQIAKLARLSGGGYFPVATSEQLAGVVDTIDSVGLCHLAALPTTTIGSGGSATTPTLGNGVKGALPESTNVTVRKPVARFVTRLAGNPSVIDLTLSWADKSATKRGKKKPKSKPTKFALLPLTLVAGKRSTAVPVAKLRKALRGRTVRHRGLKIKGSRGATFVTFRIAGLGGASTSSVPAHAASRFDRVHAGVRRKGGRRKGGRRAYAAAAKAAKTTRVSLSAYRRR
jgi:hypothetical protein